LDFFLDKIDQNDKDYMDILNNKKNLWYILFANNTIDYFTLTKNIFIKDINSKEIITTFDLEERILILFKKAFSKGLKIDMRCDLIGFALYYKKFNLLDFFLDNIDTNNKDCIKILNKSNNLWENLLLKNDSKNILLKLIFDIENNKILYTYIDISYSIKKKIELLKKAFEKGLKITYSKNLNIDKSLLFIVLKDMNFNFLNLFLDFIDQNNEKDIAILNNKNIKWSHLIDKTFDEINIKKALLILNKAFEKGLKITYLEDFNINSLFIVLSYALYKKDYNSLNLFLDSIDRENKENVNFLNNNISILNIIISEDINLELKKELFKKAFQKGFIINKENFISLSIYMIIFFESNLFNFFFKYSNNYNLNFQNSDLNNVQYYLQYFSDNNNAFKNHFSSIKLQAYIKDIISKKIQNKIDIISNHLPLDKIYYSYVYNKFTNTNNIIYSQTYTGHIIEISYYMIYDKDKNKYKLYFFPLSENNMNVYYPFEENESEKILIPIFDHNNPNNIICYLNSSIEGPDYTKESLPESQIILKKDIIQYNPCFNNLEYI